MSRISDLPFQPGLYGPPAPSIGDIAQWFVWISECGIPLDRRWLALSSHAWHPLADAFAWFGVFAEHPRGHDEGRLSKGIGDSRLLSSPWLLGRRRRRREQGARDAAVYVKFTSGTTIFDQYSANTSHIGRISAAIFLPQTPVDAPPIVSILASCYVTRERPVHRNLVGHAFSSQNSLVHRVLADSLSSISRYQPPGPFGSTPTTLRILSAILHAGQYRSSMVYIYVTIPGDDVWTGYDVDPLDSVRKLKADIEEAKGFALGRQCLQYEGIDLQDEWDFQSLRSGCILQLVENQVVVRIDRYLVNVDALKSLISSEEIKCPVDLEGRVSDLRDTLISTVYDLRGENFESFDFKQHHLELDDDRTLSELGIQNNDSIALSVGVRELVEYSVATLDLNDRITFTPSRNLPAQKALYDWDGNMKHSKIKGLPLQKGMSVIVTNITSPWWRGHARGSNEIGYFPAQFIGISRAGDADESPGPVPSLPEFQYPEAFPLSFKFSVGERGHSYVQINLDYNTLTRPDEPTEVVVTLKCVAAGGRSITSHVKSVHFPQLATPQQLVQVEVTKQKTAEHHADLHVDTSSLIPMELGVDAGKSTEDEETRLESGTRASRMEFEGFVSGQDTAHWMCQGALGVGQRDGVPSTMKLSFTLEEKPDTFHYACYLTTIRDGKEVRRSAGTREFWAWIARAPRRYGLISG
ncbi:hypothetical protein B0H19DRAFT_1083207 [Mycena capillaripes]|nr:hypothetical protein B0H19DRAFT_1083207 [Mycena capillaripes]